MVRERRWQKGNILVERVAVPWDDLADLELDPDNPRHEPGMSRREIINYLVGSESVLGLARDIATVGLSPLDIFGAIRAPEGGFVVLEGNRRLCALLLLHDPSLAPAKERKSFDRIKQDFDLHQLRVDLAIFADRDEANVWIERKHSGQAGGLGPRPWTATQQARHYGEKTGNQLALALLELAVERKILTSDQSGRIITTITRFVSTPFVREHGLGIVTNASVADFKIKGTQSLFEKRLRRLLTDIVQRANGATSRAGSADRAKYAQDFLVPLEDDEVPDNGNSSDAGGTAAGGSEANPDTTNNASQSTEQGDNRGADAGAQSTNNSPKHPSDRQLLVPATFAISFRDARLARILAELKLARKQSPLSAALLVRVFMEAITVRYLETRKVQIATNEKLHLLVHNVLTRVDQDRKDGVVHLSKGETSALALLKSQVTQTGYVYSAAYLGMVAHGAAFPEWSTLTSKWDEIEPILLHIAGSAEAPSTPSRGDAGQEDAV